VERGFHLGAAEAEGGKEGVFLFQERVRKRGDAREEKSLAINCKGIV